MGGEKVKTKLEFFKYVSFSMISMLGMSCYCLADTLFIANGVGLNGLTALNLVLPIYNVIFAIGLLLGVGGATRYAIARAQHKHHEASLYFTHALTAGIVISIPIMIIGFFYAYQVVELLGARLEIRDTAGIYLKSFIAFTPFFISQSIIVSFIRNDHNPRLASLAMLAGTLFNILFDYILVFPCKLGMMGAALATGCSPIITLLICSYHFLSHHNHFHIVKTSFLPKQLLSIIQIGLPSFITELSSGIIIYVFNSVALSIGGNIAVASYGVISNLAIVITSLYSGISQGIQPLLSHSFGAQKMSETKTYVRLAMMTSTVLSLIVFISTLLFPQTIIAFFNSESNAMMAHIAELGLPLYFVSYFFVGMNMIIISYFSSTDQVKPSSLLSILRGGVIVIPLVLILSYFFSMTGLWMSYPISECIILIIALYFLKKSLTFYS